MQQEIRQKNDLRALTVVKNILTDLAIDLMQKLEILEFLKTSRSLEEICNNKKIKNKLMLENILDLLVGEDILLYENEKYKVKIIKRNSSQEDLNFLKTNYKESLDWIYFVNQFSEETLRTGRPSELTGFEESKAIYYWNKIMEQSPYSLRVIAINELYKDLLQNSTVLDYGCGGGVGIQQLIELSNEPISIFGTYSSSVYFDSARERIQSIKLLDELKQKNRENVTFINFENLDSFNGKFDRIFISIIFNHIAPQNYINVIKRVKLLLKPNGKLGIVQLLDFGKFKRNPIWVMYNVPSHIGYPERDYFISCLKKTFTKVDILLDGIITISTN